MGSGVSSNRICRIDERVDAAPLEPAADIHCRTLEDPLQ
jgi:hypothetical protein